MTRSSTARALSSSVGIASLTCGWNGAGKTTLLRILAARRITSGELAIQKGARISLHDQARPRRAEDVLLREWTVASDLPDSMPRASCAGSRRRWRPAITIRSSGSGGYAKAQARLEHAGGYAWRERVAGVLRGPRFPGRRSGSTPVDLFRRRADARLPRPRARRGSAAAPPPRRADQPPRRAGSPSGSKRSSRPSTPPSCSSRTTAGPSRRRRPPGWSSRPGARCSSPGRGTRGLWEKAGRESPRAEDRSSIADDIVRLERFVERFRYKKAKARQAQAKLSQIGRLERGSRGCRRRGGAPHQAHATARVRLPEPPRSG